MAETVTVICRLPSGVRLDLYDMKGLAETAQANKAGAQMVPGAPVRSVILEGARHDRRYAKFTNAMLGMGGRTVVDAAFWEAWLAQNKNSELVRRNLVFAEASTAKAEGKLKEVGSHPTGLEGVDTAKLVGDVQTLGG
ncbi:hypothetical protein E3E12_07900 [Formicincola oecophyllae]|uniref:Uncharacterized protein n=1 Tax=Formicincola oecophyllae TaxID=2558361 RepID=A0A4Y6U9H5_9PROT|nr:hypothetical protein [Formicincola oecophyllae]QDH14119.1 hypothetical protein E3E12_07900 [Formicincola oecophyllae]